MYFSPVNQSQSSKRPHLDIDEENLSNVLDNDDEYFTGAEDPQYEDFMEGKFV